MLDSTRSVFILICICTSIGIVPKILRPWVAALLSIFYYWYSTRDISIIFLSAFILSSFLPYLSLLIQEDREAIFRRIRSASICITVCFYLLFGICISSRFDSLSSSLPLRIPYILGISYITLQVIDILLNSFESYFSSSWVEKLSYLIYSPQFAAGPVEKSGTLIPALSSPNISSIERRLIFSFKHLLPGLIRKSILLPISYKLIIYLRSSEDGIIGSIFLLVFSYFYLYQDIQSYTEIAQGVSALAGIRLVQNFKEPFRAITFSDFWRRWHISVSEWFTSFIGKPIMKAIVRVKFLDNYTKELTGSIVFLAFGIWHGFSINSLICGLILAFGYMFECWTKKKNMWNRWIGFLLVQSAVSVVCYLLLERNFKESISKFSISNIMHLGTFDFITIDSVLGFAIILASLSLIGFDSSSKSLLRLIDSWLISQPRPAIAIIYVAYIVGFSLLTFQSVPEQNNYMRLDF